MDAGIQESFPLPWPHPATLGCPGHALGVHYSLQPPEGDSDHVDRALGSKHFKPQTEKWFLSVLRVHSITLYFNSWTSFFSSVLVFTESLGL